MMRQKIMRAAVLLVIFMAPTVFAATTDDFIITVEIPGISSSFVIPTNFLSSGDYDYNVDCNVADNDGLENEGGTGSYVCNYAAAGTYDIAISDNKGDGTGFPAIFFNNTGDKDKLIDIKQWGTGKWRHMGFAFYGASNMMVTATDTPDFSNVTTMHYMFANSPADPDTSSWDTSEVKNMSGMFRSATNAEPDTSNWDTSNVLFMNSAFSGASNAMPDTSNWDTAKVLDMSFMFDGSPAIPDTSGWDTSHVGNMYAMFRFATAANPNTSNWDTSNVTNMGDMFWGATSANPDTSNWDTSNVTGMVSMFREATSANPDTSSWNIEAVMTMAAIFSGTNLPTQYYDAMLVGFDAQNLQPNVVFDAGGSHYCGAVAERTHMMDSTGSGGDGWMLTDSGLDCSQRDPIVAPDMQAASDLGLDNRDDITSDDTPTFDIACSFDILTRIKVYTDNPAANTLIAQRTCRNEIASLVSSSLPVGMHNISYVYSGLLADSAHSPALAIEISDFVLVGDCTGTDGVVNINDVICAINVVLDDGVPVRGEDVDGSGVVTITDVIAIINIVLGI